MSASERAGRGSRRAAQGSGLIKKLVAWQASPRKMPEAAVNTGLISKRVYVTERFGKTVWHLWHTHTDTCQKGLDAKR